MSISIVVPVYNVEKYLVEAIESILSQTVLPGEVIIVDDGSTDSSGRIADSYAHNSLFKIFHTPNQGLSGARNFGAEKASGDYLYFFDSDDVLNKHLVEDMQTIINSESPDLIFFSAESFYDEGSSKDFDRKYHRGGLNATFASGAEALQALEDTGIYITSAVLHLIKRSFWQQYDFSFKSILHEDDEILLPMTALAQKVVVKDQVYYYRRVRQGSIMTSTATARNLTGYITTLDSLFTFRDQHNNVYQRIRHIWNKRVITYALKVLKMGSELNINSGRRLVIKSILATRNPRLLAKLFVYSLPATLQKLLGQIRTAVKS